MKKNTQIICILIVVIFVNIFTERKTIESMELKKRDVVLVGDSVFDNQNYVDYYKSVNYLVTHNKIINSKLVARDNARVKDLNNQLNSIKSDISNKNKTVFISIGGNDILTFTKQNYINSLNTVFTAYEKTLDKYDFQCKLVLCNIYVPYVKKNTLHEISVKLWNNKLSQYCESKKYKLFDLSKLLYKKNDFIDEIEPSEIGSEKLVSKLIEYVD